MTVRVSGSSSDDVSSGPRDSRRGWPRESRLIIAAAVVVVAAALVGVAIGHATASASGTISVTGSVGINTRPTLPVSPKACTRLSMDSFTLRSKPE